MMTFTVPGTPLSVNRVHRMGVTSTGKRLMYYTQEGKKYRSAVAFHALSARHRDWTLTRQYEVEIVSYFASDRSDADNPVKPCLDSLQGVLFTNDKQVVRVVASKAVDKIAPRLVVTVRAVGDHGR